MESLFEIMALFVSHDEYDRYYPGVENLHEYAETKASMLHAISMNAPAEVMSATEAIAVKLRM
jgi:hypothetical protein